MDFFQNLASQVSKIAEDVAETIKETVNEIANSEDLYETRNNSRTSSVASKEDLNAWTLLEGKFFIQLLFVTFLKKQFISSLLFLLFEGDIDNADDFKERVVRVPDNEEYNGVWSAQIDQFNGEWGKHRLSSLFIVFYLISF